MLLLNHPDKLKTLLAEIDSAFPSEHDSITYAKTQELPYLNAVLNESMRLKPIVVAGQFESKAGNKTNKAGLARITTESTVLCNHEIPPGVSYARHKQNIS
jgi:cytochrome P450